MNEKEALRILQAMYDYSESYSEQQDLESIIEWLQRRSDIKDLLDNPPDPWTPANSPYILKLAKFYADDALLELNMFIQMDGIGLPTLHSAIRFARAAKEYFDTHRRQQGDKEKC